MEQTRDRHFAVLDGLRGVAALAVTLMHIGEILLLPNILPQAYLAVPFFFVLSGFVIAYAYEDGLMHQTTAIGFMLVRIERLYPLLFVGLAMGTAFVAFRAIFKPANFSIPEMLTNIGAAIIMLPRPGAAAFPALPPQWSLSLELWGNLIHYIFRSVLTRARLAIALPIAFVFMAWGSFHYGGLGTGWNLDNLAGGVATLAFSYGAGIMIYRLLQEERLPGLKIPVWAIVTLLVVTLGFPQLLRTPANALRDLICAAILYPIILMAALQTNVTSKLLDIVTWLGRMSYPLYIVHYPVVTVCCFALLKLKAPLWAMYAAVPLVAAIATLTAWVLLVWIDEPFRSWARRTRVSRRQSKLLSNQRRTPTKS